MKKISAGFGVVLFLTLRLILFQTEFLEVHLHFDLFLAFRISAILNRLSARYQLITTYSFFSLTMPTNKRDQSADSKAAKASASAAAQAAISDSSDGSQPTTPTGSMKRPAASQKSQPDEVTLPTNEEYSSHLTNF